MSSEFHIDYTSISQIYAKEQPTGTLYLAFRDLPQLLKRYSLLSCGQPVQALDFGCGTGVSTRYLKSLTPLFQNGLEVKGADISSHMLARACEADPIGNYSLLQQDQIDAPDESFDLVFSSFVLFEFATLKKMQYALEEIKRVMKKGALFIAITGSVETYRRSNEWVSLIVDFPQNDHLKTGDLGRVDFKVGGEVLTFQNYYWTEEDYQAAFLKSGLHLEETCYPLGNQAEENLLSWKWKSELFASPYYIFILTRSLEPVLKL